VLEEIAKISPSVAFPIFESCFGPVLTIQHFASDALKQRLVPKVCSGDMVIAASMSEPDAGTALTDLKTRALRQGDTLVLT
uniref:acyl-CoA dehydrogenase family protein n=1 Tax=Acinetobacter baumannii TaxID=470 RepID=UPI0034D2C057